MIESVSWWAEDFEKRLPVEQARMKRELTPKATERVLETLRKVEEAELRGEATLRNSVVAKGFEEDE